MADEEAVLKKKLEDTSDFEERRAIRQQLRDVRKKKLDALESDTAANDRPRRRERVKKDEQTTVITKTKSTEDSSQPGIQTKIEVNYSRTTVISGGPAENGIENGHSESEKSVEDETVSVENENPVEQQPDEVESGTQFTVQVNGEKSTESTSEPEQVDSATQELSTETVTVVESSGTAGDAKVDAEEAVKEEEAAPKEDDTEEVELTPEVVEKMEDIDMLERLLKEVPLNEYAIRKAIRLQIRQLRVKKEKSKESENLSRFRNVKQTKQDNLPGKAPLQGSTSLRSEPSESFESQMSETAVTVLKELEAGDEIKTDTDNEKTETVESDCDADDASSTRSSVTSESPSESDNPRIPPPRPPRPTKTPSTSSETELTGDFKSRILGSPAGPVLRDLSKKEKPAPPEQVDFRGQLKKTGLRADKDLSASGKRQQQLREGDFRGQLKSTGVDTSRNLSTPRFVSKKKEGPVQVDFRGHLNKAQGESSDVKKTPPRPPPTYLTKKAEAGALTSQSSPKSQATECSASKKDDKQAQSSGKEGRKLSSADLFNMLNKPVETSKEGYLVQRGLKKAEASKGVTQKFGAPSVDTSTEDEKFQARMARRKERSEKHILPGKGAKGGRKMSSGLETKDFQSILRKAGGVQQPRKAEKSTDADTEEQSSKGSERFSVDIQNKDELQKLRANLLREQEQKGKDGVTSTTEKSTEVQEVDGGKITQEVTKTTEVHEAGGATMTVTKTTKTTEVHGKGGSIEAVLAQKKKEKIIAKKQQQASVKNKRMAFKEQLEAQSPKVEGGRNFQSGHTAINSLQEWCRRRTKYHEGVEIQNFTTSWANGLAMCALLNYFLPEKIPYETLNPSDRRANWTLAFKVANEEGVEPLLELEDVMAVDVPEPKSLITYVHFIYQHFTEKQQQ